MKNVFCAVSLLAALAAAADPSITGQTLVANDDGTVTITYTLSGGPAIVTLDMLDDGVSVGATNLWALSGDVNMVVDKTDCSITWDPTVAWRGRSTAKLSAALTAWSTDDPPDYLVFDLTKNPVVRKRYYVSADALPGGILANEAYRRYLLPMRRMHSKNVTWKMGNTVDPSKSYYSTASAYEIEHDVTLDHDYYIAVFETTRGQYAMVSGKWNPLVEYAGNEDVVAMRPLVRVTYGNTRGGAGYLYPTDPNPNYPVGLLRARCGDNTMDLPSEAEWEFAARGGQYGDVFGWSGDNAITAANLASHGRYDGNKNAAAITDGTKNSWAVCGSYLPNAYGLYDMNGNVLEWCLDWYEDDVSWNTAGVPNADGANLADGTTAGEKRVARGGYISSTLASCRNGYRRYIYGPGEYKTENGFRLVCRDTLP